MVSSCLLIRESGSDLHVLRLLSPAANPADLSYVESLTLNLMTDTFSPLMHW